VGHHPCYRTGTGDATAPHPGYPRDSTGRSDDAMGVAMARSSKNGGTTLSVVQVVPPQRFNLQGHLIHGRGHRATPGFARGTHAARRGSRDPLYSSLTSLRLLRGATRCLRRQDDSTTRRLHGPLRFETVIRSASDHDGPSYPTQDKS